ncbi:MAG: hypothetical protein N2485_08385 [bacterium]|nr:hypothetical protein [bacterium]
MGKGIDTNLNKVSISFDRLCRLQFSEFRKAITEMSYEELYELYYYIKNIYMEQSDLLRVYGGKESIKWFLKEKRQEAKEKYAHLKGTIPREDFYNLINSYIKGEKKKLGKLSQKDFYKIMGRLKKYGIMAKLVYFEALVKARKALASQMQEQTGLTEEDVKEFDLITKSELAEDYSSYEEYVDNGFDYWG